MTDNPDRNPHHPSTRSADDDGIESIEYALISVLVVAALVIAVPLLTGSVEALLQFVADQFAGAGVVP